MSFGVKNIGSTYKRVMIAIFHEMPHDYLEDYVEDIMEKLKKGN